MDENSVIENYQGDDLPDKDLPEGLEYLEKIPLPEDTIHIEKDLPKYAKLWHIVGQVNRGVVEKSLISSLNALTFKKLYETQYHRMLGMTWKVFCKNVLGYSHTYVNDEIKNIDHYGADFLQKGRALGLTRTELIKYRGLPEPKTEEIKELIEQGDADGVRLIYEEQIREEKGRTEKALASTEREKKRADDAEAETAETKKQYDRAMKIVEELEYRQKNLMHDHEEFLRFLRKFKDLCVAQRLYFQTIDTSKFSIVERSQIAIVMDWFHYHAGVMRDEFYADNMDIDNDLKVKFTDVELGKFRDEVKDIFDPDKLGIPDSPFYRNVK